MATAALSAYIRKATSRSLVLAYSCGRCNDFFTAHMYHHNHHQRFQRPPRPGRRPARPLPWLSCDRRVDSLLEAKSKNSATAALSAYVRKAPSRPFVLAYSCVGAKQTKLAVGLRMSLQRLFGHLMQSASKQPAICIDTRPCRCRAARGSPPGGTVLCTSPEVRAGVAWPGAWCAIVGGSDRAALSRLAETV